MSILFATRRRPRFSVAVGLALMLAPGASRAADRPPVESPVWVGSGSCAATACHGGRREPLALKGSEYAFSEAYDPHVRAYSVLFDDRSKLIEKNYRRLADLEGSKPFEDDACLRCHVHQGYDSKATWTRTAGFALADGAGCEACHGAAGKWLVPHVESSWKGLSEGQKAGLFGMRPTKDLLARGQACAECHVGQGTTDVNHDLIAAGHPRLNFEYGSQLAKLPKHWRVEDDKARHPDYEAKVWVLGQLLTARASLDLLESRAARSIPDDSTVPWPEFAEYSCFSCHHELLQRGWASANVSNAGKAGSLQWGTWSLPLAKNLPRGLLALDPDEPGSPFGSLRTSMTGLSPDAKVVARRARAAADEVGRVADSLNRGVIAPSEVRAMLHSFKVERSATPLDWDLAARQYLAIVALDKAAGELDPRYADASIRGRLKELRDHLDLPRTVDGGRAIFDSPYRVDLGAIKDDLKSVQAALPNP